MTTYITKAPVDLTERQPCWYADCVEEDGQMVWKVGLKDQESNEEFVFAADPNDESQRSLKFATRLMEVFKEGRSKGVEDWLKNGCP